jgi:hypothetical protein
MQASSLKCYFREDKIIYALADYPEFVQGTNQLMLRKNMKVVPLKIKKIKIEYCLFKNDWGFDISEDAVEICGPVELGLDEKNLVRLMTNRYDIQTLKKVGFFKAFAGIRSVDGPGTGVNGQGGAQILGNTFGIGAIGDNSSVTNIPNQSNMANASNRDSPNKVNSSPKANDTPKSRAVDPVNDFYNNNSCKRYCFVGEIIHSSQKYIGYISSDSEIPLFQGMIGSDFKTATGKKISFDKHRRFFQFRTWH